MNFSNSVIWPFGEWSLNPSWPRHFLWTIQSNTNWGFGNLSGDREKSENWMSIIFRSLCLLKLRRFAYLVFGAILDFGLLQLLYMWMNMSSCEKLPAVFVIIMSSRLSALNLSAFQPFNLSAFQPFSLSAFQPFTHFQLFRSASDKQIEALMNRYHFLLH